ncbi:hypothetical protein Mapa_002463 [Marchantia paleacea]|nr:hypothetical protein Mapa_002463 [Marchantia paleacea]
MRILDWFSHLKRHGCGRERVVASSTMKLKSCRDHRLASILGENFRSKGWALVRNFSLQIVVDWRRCLRVMWLNLLTGRTYNVASCISWSRRRIRQRKITSFRGTKLKVLVHFTASP